jgi:hypothetical protein
MNIKELKEDISRWQLSKERVIHFSIGIAALIIYEFIARPYYRPYIYQHHINDFHIADTLGNSLGTIATIYTLIALFGRTRPQHIFLINTITISVALYEVAHPLLGKPNDPWDIVATIVSGGFCYLLYRWIHPQTSALKESE